MGELDAIYVQHEVEYASDDISGAWLDPVLVRERHDVEMAFFDGMGVYERVPRSEQTQTGGKIIGTKWIDVNNGDFVNPRIRCRLVDKEFKTGPDDALHASTPPLEALRVLLSRAATVDEGGETREMIINDVSRAYFYAKAIRPVYVKLPDEDRVPGDEQKCGKLKMSMYGTRDAALNWALEYADTLRMAGYVQGKGNPCLFHKSSIGVSIMVHGDGFIAVGPEEHLGEARRALEDKYKLKVEVLGHG